MPQFVKYLATITLFVGIAAAQLTDERLDDAQGIIDDVLKNANHQRDIDRYRKGDFALKFVDENGYPVKIIPRLTLTLKQHDFRFGSSVRFEALEDDLELAWYRSRAANLFSAVTPQRNFMWPNYEPSPGNYQAQQEKFDASYVRWAEGAGIKWIRGHALEWQYTGFGWGQFWARKVSCMNYTASLQERIRRELQYYRGVINEYTVWNSPLHDKYLLDECKLWDTAFQDAFRWANEEDPDARLCLSEYDVIEPYGTLTDEYIERIQTLIDAKVPISCIAVQCHLDIKTYGDIRMADMKEKIDKLAKFRLPIVISELSLRTTELQPYDLKLGNAGQGAGSGVGLGTAEYPDYDAPPRRIDPSAPTADTAGRLNVAEDEQAKMIVELMNLFFGHPWVDSVYFWEFWDPLHWVTNGGIIDSSKEPKLAAVAYRLLTQNTWTTNVNVSKPRLNRGVYNFKGYYGVYQYRVWYHGKVYNGQVEFRKSQPRDAEVMLTY